MIPTSDFVARKFDFFNNLCFRGSLPTPKFIISNSKTFAGQLKYRIKKTRLKPGVEQCFDFKLCISRRFDFPEEAFEDTIIHEMIHYYIAVNGLSDTAPHGRRFKMMMNDINDRFKRHISVSMKRPETNTDEPTLTAKLSIVCLMRLHDGSHIVSLPARTRLFEFWDIVEHSRNITASAWYASRRPFFDKFPRTVKGKAYRITPEEIRRELADAFTLGRTSDGIAIVSRTPPSPDFGGCLLTD